MRKLHYILHFNWAISLILLTYWLIMPSALIAQKKAPTPFFEFEQMNLPGGLQGNTVNCMAEDAHGFVWFGTVNGLTRYDGRDFIRYRHNRVDSNSLVADYVESILVDSKGVLWVGSLGKGLTRFNPSTNTFKRFEGKRDHPNGLIDGIINTIIEAKDGVIWIGTNSGITKLNPATQNFKHYKASEQFDGRVRVLYEDKAGNIWAGAGLPWEYNPAKGGLYRLNPTTEKLTAYLHNPNDPTSLSDNRVGAIFEDSNDNFWVGTMGDGLQKLDIKTGEFTRFPYTTAQDGNQLSRPFLTLDKTVDVNYSQVGFIHEDEAHNLWIGAFYGGLNVYNPKLKKQTHVEQNSPFESGLTTNYIWDILQTADRTIFICTGGNGGGKTYKVNYKTNHFPFYKIEDNRQVSYLTEDKTGNIWLGFLDSKNLIKFNDLSYGVDAKKGLNIHQIEEVARVNFPKDVKQCGTTLLQFTDNGIQLIDAQNGEVKIELAVDEQKNKLKAHTIWIIHEDLNNNYWIATWGGGLFFVNTQKGTISNYKNEAKNATSIGGNYVSHIFEDRKGQIWIAGGQKSNNVEFPLFIDRINVKAGTFEHFVAHEQQYGFVPSIAEDKQGNLWYTTTVDGIRKLNPITKETTEFKQANTLIPSDEIRALVIDRMDKIWMSTEKTLVKFDPVKQSFFTYDDADGIQLDNFGFGVSFLTATGQAIFGGDGGFHIFDPLELTRNTLHQSPKIQITALQLNNQKVAIPIWEKESLHLSYQENTFAFGINCIDYKNPTKVHLEYRLEEYDGIWRKAGSEKTANYVNVPPGTYLFKVRGANSEGYLSEQEKTIKIIISPPWWQTWWSKLLGLLMIAGAIYSFYRFQLNRQRIVQEGQQLKKIDTIKTRFYGNITHEFRTPLTLIIGLSKQLAEAYSLEQEVVTKLKIIERNGKQSLRLVNQLLDLRKLKAGHLELALIQGDILPLFRYALDNFHSFAASKDIDLVLNIPDEPVIMDYDPNRVYEITANLLMNAIKFTPEDGSIYMTISILNEKTLENNTKEGITSTTLSIKVKDTGIGIPKSALSYIFDRFHQVRGGDNDAGTGIGLALVKEFSEMMGGVVQVKSIPKVGSEFEVFLPISQQSINADNIFKSDLLRSDLLVSTMPITKSSKKDQSKTATAQTLILIVEDNEEVASFIASFLNKYKVAFAKNGQIGINKAMELIPDLIISDVMMPQKNGFELCETLKQSEKTSHIPIILLTARATETDKISGLKKGADAYLTKPFSNTELLLWVSNLLQTRKELHQRYAKPNLPIASEKTASFDLIIEDTFVKKVIALIEKNSTNPDYSVTLIAEEVHLSSSQLHRKVSAVTGKSPIQLLRLHRLNKAKELLANKTLSISEVAYQAGFNDPSYFTRTFTKVFKIKPSAYREQLV